MFTRLRITRPAFGAGAQHGAYDRLHQGTGLVALPVAFAVTVSSAAVWMAELAAATVLAVRSVRRPASRIPSVSSARASGVGPGR
ncbi:hypothetical protein ACPEIC_12565 [Stenotrophomonas sp. NPDC087984]